MKKAIKIIWKFIKWMMPEALLMTLCMCGIAFISVMLNKLFGLHFYIGMIPGMLALAWILYKIDDTE